MRPHPGMLSGLVFVSLVGCTDPPITPDARISERFAVECPDLPTRLFAGQEVSIPFRLDRGEGYRKDVEIRARPPKDLQARPRTGVVTKNDPGTVYLIVKAYPDTPLGEYVIRIEVTPDAARSVLADVRVSVVSPTESE
ncbi:MAG: hypothetical protein ACRC7O_13410 [Fimbriiglobus sp.]